MNTKAHAFGAPGVSTPAALLPNVWSTAIWLVASSIAVFFALLVRDSAVIDGAYLPQGNDSFYHARRILDAAIGSRGFNQFDDRLQVPEGTWIPWPWAYDYLMAKATQLALWFAPTLDPMAFIAYVPVVWVFVNAALFMAVTGEIGLPRELRLLAMLCFALSPLTQLLHAIGMVDHHYMEHTFVLLNAWLGLLWFKRPDEPGRAVALAVALGLAPGFHNGLFILQLVPVGCAFVLWLRAASLPAAAVRSFSIALLVTTLLVLLPSAPFREGVYEFGLLSWFHLHVACCTAAALGFMAWRRFTPANLGLLGLLSLLLTIPMRAQLMGGAAFLSAEFSIMDEIIEARSPYDLFTATFGPVETASYYSWLLLLAPALLAYYGYRIARETQPDRLYYAIVVVFGLTLLLTQLRLQYFGFFGLITGALLLLEELRARRSLHRGATFAAAFALIALAYQPALRERLFIVYAPGADAEYASAFSLFLDLGAHCAVDPGVVLANPNDGSPILFHSECSVIANNFGLRPPDKVHIDEVQRLMLLSPAEIRAQRPDIKYVLVRARDFTVVQDGVEHLVADSPIAKQLFIDAEPPPGYTLVRTVLWRVGVDGPSGPYARLYKLEPSRGERGG